MPPSPSIPRPAGLVRKTERGTRIAAAVLGAALTACAGYLALLNLGESLVSLSYDMPFIVHRAGATDDIRIVYLDNLLEDGKQGVGSPEKQLDRRPQARLLDKLGEAGARAVVYDLIFEEESPDPAVDEEFAAAMRKFRGIDAQGNPIPGAPRRYVMLAAGLETLNQSGLIGESVHGPNEKLLDAADGSGLAAWDDKVLLIRKLARETPDDTSLVWSTAKLLGAPLDEKKRMDPRWVNFSGPPADSIDPASGAAFPSCLAESVLRGDMNPAFLRNKIVVIGGKPGIVGMELGKDLFATPYHRFETGGKLPLMSGVEVTANGLANLLNGNWLTRTKQPFDISLMVVAGILLGAGMSLLRPVNAILTSIAMVFAVALTGVLSVHFGHTWFPWSVVGFLQVPIALVWSIASHSYVERFFRIKLTAEQAAFHEAFKKYMSPEMLDQIIADGFRIDLGGEEVQATMMFTDLESFTNMSERLGKPQQIVSILNDYFERTTSHIFHHNGTIIKYIGDAIFAAWGVPRPDGEAAVKSVRAAWDLSQNDKLEVEGEEYRTRIGLHSGKVVAGNIGSSQRVDYTLIGDAVNMAARLEGLNKMFGTNILMSDEVHVNLGNEFRTRRVGKIRVKGRNDFTVVHELLGPSLHQNEPEWITEYHQALAALENNEVEKALGIFTSVDATRGSRGDGPSKFFIKQINSGKPIADGIVDMTEK